MSDTWPNGVPYIDEDTRRENLRDPDALGRLISSLWLVTGRRAETSLTTEEKELFADAVEKYNSLDGYKFDRWWQR